MLRSPLWRSKSPALTGMLRIHLMFNQLLKQVQYCKTIPEPDWNSYSPFWTKQKKALKSACSLFIYLFTFHGFKGINHSPKEKNPRETIYTTDVAFYETSWVVITHWRTAHKLGIIPTATGSTWTLLQSQAPRKCRLSAVHRDATNSKVSSLQTFWVKVAFFFFSPEKEPRVGIS